MSLKKYGPLLGGVSFESGNGCGPAWMPKILKSILFDWFFEASCNRHDQGYIKGGNEIRRFECDWKFWLAMKRDSERYSGVSRYARLVQAKLYYRAVRIFGSRYFNYKE